MMGGNIKGSPRFGLMGFFADALKGAQSGMNRVELPYLGGMGNFILGGAPKLADDISYQGLSALVRGGNAATGGIGTYGIKPETADLVGVMTGLGGIARPAVNAAGRAALPVAREFVETVGARNMSGMPMAKSQIGMIKTGAGKIPQTSKEIDSMFDFFENKADSLGIRNNSGSSNVSSSKYITLYGPEGTDGSPGKALQIRISNHGDRYPNSSDADERFSIDPDSGNTFEDAKQWLKQNGFDLNKKPKKKEAEKSPFFGSKASDINELRKKYNSPPVTIEDIERLGLINDVGL